MRVVTQVPISYAVKSEKKKIYIWRKVAVKKREILDKSGEYIRWWRKFCPTKDQFDIVFPIAKRRDYHCTKLFIARWDRWRSGIVIRTSAFTGYQTRFDHRSFHSPVTLNGNHVLSWTCLVATVTKSNSLIWTRFDDKVMTVDSLKTTDRLPN